MHSSCVSLAGNGHHSGSRGVALLSIAISCMVFVALLALLRAYYYYLHKLLLGDGGGRNAAQVLPLNDMNVYSAPMREDRGAVHGSTCDHDDTPSALFY